MKTFVCISVVLTGFVLGIAAQIPTDGLIASFPFNGNASDDSGNGNHGTVNGATLTADRFGKENAAYSFNGFNSNIAIDYQNGDSFESAYTVSMWVKAGATQTQYAKLFCVPHETDE